MTMSLGAAVQEIERHRFLKDLRADCDYDHLFVDGEALVKKIDPAFRETYDAQAAPFIIAAANYILAEPPSAHRSAGAKYAYATVISMLLQLETDTLLKQFPGLVRDESRAEEVRRAYEAVFLDYTSLFMRARRAVVLSPSSQEIFDVLWPFEAPWAIIGLMIWASANDDLQRFQKIVGMCEDLEQYDCYAGVVVKALKRAYAAEGRNREGDVLGFSDVSDFFIQYIIDAREEEKEEEKTEEEQPDPEKEKMAKEGKDQKAHAAKKKKQKSSKKGKGKKTQATKAWRKRARKLTAMLSDGEVEEKEAKKPKRKRAKKQ